MNSKALELGLRESHFNNASGLPGGSAKDDSHCMSAYDIALLSKILLDQYPEVLQLSRLTNATIRNGTYPIENTNQLMNYFYGMDGLKTGYTDRAGRCLAATARRKEQRLISVVLGAPTEKIRTTSTVALLSCGFYNYHKVSQITIDGRVVPFSASSLFINGAALVPLQQMAEALGAGVEMRDKGVRVSRENTEMLFTVGSAVAAWDNKTVQLPQPVHWVNGNILVPLRPLSEFLGARVQWDESQKAIHIDTQ